MTLNRSVSFYPSRRFELFRQSYITINLMKKPRAGQKCSCSAVELVVDYEWKTKSNRNNCRYLVSDRELSNFRFLYRYYAKHFETLVPNDGTFWKRNCSEPNRNIRIIRYLYITLFGFPLILLIPPSTKDGAGRFRNPLQVTMRREKIRHTDLEFRFPKVRFPFSSFDVCNHLK